MTLIDVLPIVSGVTSPLAAAGIVYIAMKLDYLQRDVDRAHKRIESALNLIERVREKI